MVRKEELNAQESVVTKTVPNAASSRILISFLSNTRGCVGHDSVKETETTFKQRRTKHKELGANEMFGRAWSLEMNPEATSSNNSLGSHSSEATI